MHKKMILMLTTWMLLAQLIVVPTVIAQTVDVNNIAVTSSDETTALMTTQDNKPENNAAPAEKNDSILADDNLKVALANDVDVTQAISQEIVQSVAEARIDAKQNSAENKAPTKTKQKASRAASDYSAGQIALVGTSDDFVTAWNNTAIHYIELTGNITIPNGTGKLVAASSNRTGSLEMNGAGYSLNLGNNSLITRQTTESMPVQNSVTGVVTGGSTLFVHDFSGITSSDADTSSTTGAAFIDLNENNSYGNWNNRGNWRMKFQDVTVNSTGSHFLSLARCEVTFAGTVSITTPHEPVIAGSVIFAENSQVNLTSTNPNPILWLNNEIEKNAVVATGDSREVTLQTGAKVTLRNPGGTNAKTTPTSTVASPNSNTAGAYSAIAYAFGNVTVNQDAVLDIATAAGGANWNNRPASTAVQGPTDITAPTLAGGFGNYYVNGGTLNLHSAITDATANATIRSINGDPSTGATIAVNPGGSFFATGRTTAANPTVNLGTGNSGIVMNQPKAFDIKNIGGTGSNADTNYAAIALADATSGNTDQTLAKEFVINDSDISLWKNSTTLTTDTNGVITAPPDFDYVAVDNFKVQRVAATKAGKGVTTVTSSNSALATAFDARINAGKSTFNRIMGMNDTPQIYVQPWADSSLSATDLLTQLLAQANDDATKQNIITDADKALRVRIQMGLVPAQDVNGNLVMLPAWANKATDMSANASDSLGTRVNNLLPDDSVVGNNGFATVATNDSSTPFQVADTNGGFGIQAVVDRGSQALTSLTDPKATQTNVLDVTPPTPVVVTSQVTPTSNTISGTAATDTSSVRLKISQDGGATWGDFSAPAMVVNHAWTLPLPNNLNTDDQIQIFATDNSGRQNDATAYPTIDTAGNVGNENPARTLRFHDATFPKATIYTLGSGMYWGNQLDTIEFGTQKALTTDQQFMADKHHLGSMSITNGYTAATAWKVTAKTTTPLTHVDYQDMMLPEALQFRTEANAGFTELGAESIVIGEGTLAGGTSVSLTDSWNTDMAAPGIFMNLKGSDSYIAGDYEGEVEWTMEFTPPNED